MSRYERLADIELSILEDAERCSDVIARHLDVDCRWLTDGLADIVRYPHSAEVMYSLMNEIQRHLGPVITQEAIDELERLEDPA